MPTATITRRSGRHSKDHIVELEKPADEYIQGEQFQCTIGGVTRTVHVEIPIGEVANTLHIADS